MTADASLASSSLDDARWKNREVHEIVDRFGSPAYVYDLRTVVEAWNCLRSCLPSRSKLLYAVKANPHPRLLGLMRQLGAGAEVSSLGEAAAAFAAGFESDDVLFTGPAKSDRTLAQAISIGVRTFSLESPAEAHRASAAASRAGVTVRALLRANVDTGVAGGGLVFGGRPSPFGCDLSHLMQRLPELLELDRVETIGSHFFLGTNFASEAALLDCFAVAIDAAARLIEAGLPQTVIDLGGGFGSPYGAPASMYQFPQLRAGLERLLDGRPSTRADQSHELWFESGRYLVGGCRRLLCSVVDVKISKGERYVVVDSGIHHLDGWFQGVSGRRR